MLLTFNCKSALSLFIFYELWLIYVQLIAFILLYLSSPYIYQISSINTNWSIHILVEQLLDVVIIVTGLPPPNIIIISSIESIQRRLNCGDSCRQVNPLTPDLFARCRLSHYGAEIRKREEEAAWRNMHSLNMARAVSPVSYLKWVETKRILVKSAKTQPTRSALRIYKPLD